MRFAGELDRSAIPLLMTLMLFDVLMVYLDCIYGNSED